MSDFKLKFQDLLRQHVDLGILLLDLFRQLLKLSGLARGRVWSWGKCLPETGRARESYENQRAQNSSGQQFHGTLTLALAAFAGKRAGKPACLCTISP